MHSLPPFDPTVARPSAKKPVAAPAVRALRPILASDCLVDDAAPLEPFARSGRVALVVAGVGALGLAAALVARGERGPGLFAVAAAGALSIGGAMLQRYALRGALAVGAAVVGLAGLAVTSPVVSFRALAPMILASSLLLRATYRDNVGVRVALGLGVLAFAGAATFAGGAPVFAADVTLLPRIVAGAMGLSTALALLGFMGEETTAGSTAWSMLALVTGAAGLVCAHGTLTQSLGNAAVAALLPIGTVGSAMLVAVLLGPRLRRRARERSTIRPVDPESEPEIGET